MANKNARENKKSQNRPLRHGKWLCVCEGEKTEPNYIKNLVRYANSISDKPNLNIDVYGEGRNTQSLIEATDIYRKYAPYEKIFVLFDKDSFEPSQFDNAIKMAAQKGRGYIPIWSNECFELWFILHYERFPADNGRKSYYKKLDKLLETDYEKSDDVFSMIHNPARIKTALKYAEALDKESQCESSPSKRVPCTQMFRLIRELERQLKIDLTKNSGV